MIDEPRNNTLLPSSATGPALSAALLPKSPPPDPARPLQKRVLLQPILNQLPHTLYPRANPASPTSSTAFDVDHVGTYEQPLSSTAAPVSSLLPHTTLSDPPPHSPLLQSSPPYSPSLYSSLLSRPLPSSPPPPLHSLPPSQPLPHLSLPPQSLQSPRHAAETSSFDTLLAKAHNVLPLRGIYSKANKHELGRLQQPYAFLVIGDYHRQPTTIHRILLPHEHLFPYIHAPHLNRNLPSACRGQSLAMNEATENVRITDPIEIPLSFSGIFSHHQEISSTARTVARNNCFNGKRYAAGRRMIYLWDSPNRKGISATTNFATASARHWARTMTRVTRPSPTTHHFRAHRRSIFQYTI
jgi:hypothetical protein